MLVPRFALDQRSRASPDDPYDTYKRQYGTATPIGSGSSSGANPVPSQTALGSKEARIDAETGRGPYPGWANWVPENNLAGFLGVHL